MKMAGGEMSIYAKLPAHWQQYHETITNNHLESTLQAISEGHVYPKAPKVMRLL
jgi:hypothetical protein